MRACRIFAALCLTATSCMNADDYLFDAQKVSRYALPGNTIASELIEPIQFDSGGHALYGFWVHPEPSATASPYTLLYFHGNKHNIDTFWIDVMRLHQTGAAVMIFDYRGYGRSAGSSTREGNLQADADAALAFAAQHGARPEDTCLYGYSLGNVPALHLASTGVDFRCIVVQSGFASLDSLIQGTTFLPIADGWTNIGRFDNVAAVRGAAAPVLVLHGASDGTARFGDNGRVLFENAPEPKALVLVPGAGHTDLPETMGDARYIRTITSWMTARALPAGDDPVP